MKFSSIALAALSGLTLAADIPKCGEGYDACPSEYPCCSVDGTCGNGYVCLGGCDPRFSNTPGSCMPAPVCKSGTTKFTSTDQITPYAEYMGDADKQPFSYLGNITTVDGKLRAQMFPNTGGSAISVSNYIWYGKVSIDFKTSHTDGVVSDMILLSDVKDEVDYEFVGNNVNEAQTNYYWHGALDYTKGEKTQVSSSTYDNVHTYEIDWQEDQITWSIDGNAIRTLKKSDTYNETSQTYAYPQTPARMQFGLWPGGASAAQGTRDWAGGQISWDTPDITDSPGYYFVEIDSITIDCYDPPSDAKKSGSKAYVYTDKAGLESNVEITDDSTILLSTDGTGTNPEGSKKNNTSSDSSNSGAVLTGVKTSSAASEAVLSGASVSTSTKASTKTSKSAAKSTGDSSSQASSDAESSKGTSLPTAAESSAAESSAAATSSSTGSNGAQMLAPVAALVAIIPLALAL